MSRRRNPYDLSETTGNIGIGKFRKTVKDKKIKHNPYDLSETTGDYGVGKFRHTKEERESKKERR